MKKLLLLVIIGMAVLLTSCEWINRPVDWMIVEVKNSNGSTLEDVVVVVRLQGDLEDQQVTFDAIDADASQEARIEIDDKFFDAFEVFISYNTYVADNGGGSVLATIDPEEPVLVTDPVGIVEYHSFRALAASNYRALIEVSTYNNGSVDVLQNHLWMGYELTE